MAEIKAQVRQEVDNPTHDDELERLALAAEAWAAGFLNIPSLELLDDESPPASPIVLPEDVKSALLLHIDAHFHRGDNMAALLKAAHDSIWHYRVEPLGV